MSVIEPVPARSIAERYLAVRLEPVSVGRLARLRHQGSALAYWFTPVWLGMFFGDPEPKDPTLLLVTRRCDGAALTTFDHEYLSEAVEHRNDLVERLQTKHIFDVCRQLSIDIDRIGTPVDA